MSRPVSGETKTSKVRVKQKNGDIYVYERKRKYDPEVGYTKTFNCRLLGKIKAGTEELVPTRPRRRPHQAAATENETPKVTPAAKVPEEVSEEMQASATATTQESPVATEPFTKDEVEWAHTGATDILEWVGKASGIDEDVRRSTHDGMARKIITVARYSTANPAQTLPRITKWQRTHPAPCETELTRKNCQIMMEELGEDRGAQMAYFKCRAARAGKSDVLAIDSTTISTYSENLNGARYGYNKDHDGLPTIKLLTAYSLKTKQPIAVIKQPGNIPDAMSIDYALKQMSWLNADSFKVVTDNGFYSWDNVVRFVRGNVKFLTRIDKGISWVKSEIEAHRDEWFDPNAICDTETSTHGITLVINREIEWVRERTRNGVAKGETEKKTVRLYLHIFMDRNKVSEEQDILLRKLKELQSQIEAGISEFKPCAQKMIDKFLIIKKRGKKIRTSISREAWRDAQKDFGVFVLLSNKKSGTFEALHEYRLREKIEESYRLQKSQGDGNNTRAWYDDNYSGRVFCQMVALGYQLYLRDAISRVKDSISVRQESDSESEWKLKQALKKWLDQKSQVDILDWFDCIEETRARRDGARLALKTELTARDKLFLSLLMTPEAGPSVTVSTPDKAAEIE